MGLAPVMMVILGLTLVIGNRHSKDNMGLFIGHSTAKLGLIPDTRRGNHEFCISFDGHTGLNVRFSKVR